MESREVHHVYFEKRKEDLRFSVLVTLRGFGKLINCGLSEKQFF